MDGDARVARGAGVLLGTGQVLTCAHVVADALGVDVGTQAPAGAVRVDFPGCQLTGEPPRARVDPFGWLPRLNGRRDIAVLNIEGRPPAEARPPLFRRCGQEYGGLVSVFGHPEAVPDGVWAEARLIGPAGENNELVQLYGQTGYPIEPGFAGAGVADRRTGEVIGCVTRVVKAGPEVRLAWMMPLEIVLDYLPDYRSILPPGPGRARATPATRADQADAMTAIAQPPAPHADSAGVARHGRQADLSPDQRAMIAALSALAEAGTPIWMDDLAARVAARIGPFFTVPPWLGGTEGATSLVLACLAQPGAMHELLEELRRWYGVAIPPQLRELDQLVRRNVPEPLLNPTDRSALYELIRDATFAQAAEAYVQAVGPLGKPLPPYMDDVIAIANVLDALSHPLGGVPPLLVFAESLAGAVSPTKAVQIRQWVARYRARHDIPAHLFLPYELGYMPAGPSPSDPAYLVIQLDGDQQAKDPLKEDRFLLTAWLQRGARFGTTLRRADPPQSLEQVRSLMEDLLVAAKQLSTGGTVLTVEFILPRDLLWYAAVDQWPAGRDNPDKKLGEVYPVVVRSRDRMREAEIWPRWERKWKWAAANCGRDYPSAIAWVPEEGKVGAKVLFDGLAGAGQPVCLALGYSPGPPHGLSRDEISVGLQAGLPIMVWCREGEPNAITAELKRLVSGRGLLDLPRLVAERRAAVGEKRGSRSDLADCQERDDDLARHLTLLFDPADRVPEPETVIRAPR
ncbi:MAG: trypsin-like peptidase domain-containing protein [Streptosporangiaceae bacterium]|jgi:hypothetical protein|nr:hypothetical protein [Actinomycetota bacterium]